MELRLRVGFNREDLVTLLQKHAVMAGMGLGFLSLHTLVLELRAGLIEIVRLETAPVVRTWNIVRMQSKMLSPAAEALRYFILEHGEASLAEHDRQWLPHLAEESALARPLHPKSVNR